MKFKIFDFVVEKIIICVFFLIFCLVEIKLIVNCYEKNYYVKKMKKLFFKYLLMVVKI